MFTFEEFQQAIRLDFTDIPEDGSEFEYMVQELLQAMGMHAQRTGVGPDDGVDIVAEETLFDTLGVRQKRRYVIQCKHFAHSGRPVGSTHVSGVTDTITRNHANGYLLITSTDLTSSLRRQLEELDQIHSQYSIQVWDHLRLEQYLNRFPVLVAKYFPTRFQKIKISLPTPKSGREAYVKNRIVSHQQEYVGTKFIPKLYVRRYVEEALAADLLSPLPLLKRLRPKCKKLLQDYASVTRPLLRIPEFVKASNDPATICSWTVDLATVHEQISKAEQSLLSYVWKPDLDYVAGGVSLLAEGFQKLSKRLKEYADEIDRILSPFAACVNDLEEAEQKMETLAGKIRARERAAAENSLIKPYREKLESKHQRTPEDFPTRLAYQQFINDRVQRFLESQSTQDKVLTIVRSRLASILKEEMEPRYPWRKPEFLSRRGLKKVESPDGDNVRTFTTLGQQLSDARKALRHSVLLPLRDEVQNAQKSLQLLIDIAGSGKTNLCCRVALQLVNKGFVVFVTGKALGKEFTDISAYLQTAITTALGIQQEHGIRDLCRVLQERDYPLIIIIDGINENTNPSMMRSTLKQIAELTREAPVRALLTSRTEYWNQYSDILGQNGFASVISGKLAKFTEEEHAVAIPVYLDHFKLDVRLENRAWEQLKRPLLLRFFCEAYGDPNRKGYRPIPPISEVRLFRLFEEYCKVKYGNIQQRLNEMGAGIKRDDVELVANLIARSCLKQQSRSLKANSALKALERHSPSAIQIYEALLDEDIVIEETLERSKEDLERFVSFVYEAFMEYLMAKVSLPANQETEVDLVRRIKKLVHHENEFVHVRGILTFLMPHCVGRYTKAYDLILKQLRRPEYVDTCVPAMLNLWDSDWEKGIWPVVQAAADNFMAIPIEQVATFVRDWLAEHPHESFLHSARENPRAIVSILGDSAVDVVANIKTPQDDVLATLLSMLELLASEPLSQQIVRAFAKLPWCSKETQVNGINLFTRIVRASVPALENIRKANIYSRNWILLDLLGQLGERWEIEPAQEIELIRLYVHVAIFDSFCLRATINSDRVWWAETLNIDIDAVQEEADSWVHAMG